jgi:hypothetical protein
MLLLDKSSLLMKLLHLCLQDLVIVIPCKLPRVLR